MDLRRTFPLLALSTVVAIAVAGCKYGRRRVTCGDVTCEPSEVCLHECRCGGVGNLHNAPSCTDPPPRCTSDLIMERARPMGAT